MKMSGKIRVNCCFVHNKNASCNRCRKSMPKATLYYSLSCNSGEWGSPDFILKFCKECWDEIFKTSMLLYASKEGKYPEYIKGRILKSLK